MEYPKDHSRTVPPSHEPEKNALKDKEGWRCESNLTICNDADKSREEIERNRTFPEKSDYRLWLNGRNTPRVMRMCSRIAGSSSVPRLSLDINAIPMIPYSTRR
jgi:hypothetical protein